MKTKEKKSKTKKLKCSVINRCCFSVNLYVVALQKQSGKYVSRVLESSGKVLEFRVSNIVGTLFCMWQRFCHWARGVIYTPYWGGTPPYWRQHTPQTVLPIRGVCTVHTVRYIRTQRGILGISLLGDPDILSVLVCLASVCIIIRILRQCFIVVRFYP